MAPRKSKEKAQVEEIPDLATGLKKCKIIESDLQELEDMKMLQSRALILWCPAKGEDRPYEGTHETVLFCDFVERGLAVPVFDFLHALLRFWGIQLHHLTLQSILHLSIFTHMCEAFLGVLPHFHLFQDFFYLSPIPSTSMPAVIGGAELVLRPENESEYLFYQPSSKGVEWKSYWFYVGNFESPLPERTPGAPKAQASWMSTSPGGSQVDKLRSALAKLKNKGVTRWKVVYSFLGRRVQPLQRRIHTGFRYEGLEDPSRFSSEKIDFADLFKR